MTHIDKIQALPTSPYEDSGLVGIVITSGIPSYLKITGSELYNIASFHWYPENPASVIFETREFIPIDNTLGTCMVKVLDNLLDITDRGGRISFQMKDGETLSFPVITYGPVSVGPLWTAPAIGL
jgi:hypothetical protein